MLGKRAALKCGHPPLHRLYCTLHGMPVYGALVGIGSAFGGIKPDHDFLTWCKKDSRDLLPLVFYCPGALDRNQRTWFEELLRARMLLDEALLLGPQEPAQPLAIHRFRHGASICADRRLLPVMSGV